MSNGHRRLGQSEFEDLSLRGYKDYGNTKSGAYMCERDATSQGMRASKNEKHP